MEHNVRVEFTQPNTVELVEGPVPEPLNGEVLIQTEQTLISTGTETAILNGDFSDETVWNSLFEYPLSPGYCNVGTVIETGANVNEDMVGQRVVSRTTHTHYATVEPEDCILVPESVMTQDAVFLELGKLALQSIRRGGVELGNAISVFGLGLVGQLVVQISDAAGAQPIFAFQTGTERRKYLPSKDHIVGLDPRDSWEHLIESSTNGRGSDIVFETTGNSEAIQTELEVLREQGRLVVLSSPTDTTEMDFHAISRHGYDVVGVHLYNQAQEPGAATEWTEERHEDLFFDLVSNGMIDIDRLVSHKENYREAPELFEKINTAKSQTMGVILEWER